ncbi:MAG: beta galactosidase jelly roll domain-containing protein [Prevotella sp.]|nr:beta galactosidase jelly roll domain-containing protein [Prevotella sp.]
MKATIITVLCMAASALGMQAKEVPLLGNVLSRESMSLNGEWNYLVDVQEEGYYDYRMNPMRWGFFRNAKPQRPEDLIEYDFDKAPTMRIPGDWNTQDDRLFFYEGTLWFKKSFQAQVPIENYRTLLYFGAVNYDCRVWVNGEEAGHHIGGFTPFNFDITQLLKNGENVVIVKVDNKRKTEAVPTLIFDWWNYGGITRDVMLVKVPTTYLENFKLQLEKNNDKKAKWREISFCANLDKPVAGQTVTLSIPELKLSQQFTTDGEGKVSGKLRVAAKKLSLWSPDNPKRYAVEVRLDGNASDVMTDSIGFRTIEALGKQILLNGQPIFLRGISIHEEKPNGGGRANCTDDAHTLLSWAKELNCNFVRLAHYPHNEHAVREAERMGILVWSEIPCYWTIAWKNEGTFANAQRQLTDMIRRDQNRANVIIWSIANETPHSPERDDFLGRLARHARSLDQSRLISMAMEVTGASNFKNRLQDNMHEYVDVVSFNQYIGWYRDVNDAPKMEWEIPYDKPVIISEFGGGAKYGLHGEKNQRWTEEFQENLYQQNIAMIQKIEGLSGTTPWILKDFRSPRRVLNGIQDYYNRKGLFSDKGEKKKAFYVLRDWYLTK